MGRNEGASVLVTGGGYYLTRLLRDMFGSKGFCLLALLALILALWQKAANRPLTRRETDS